MISLDELGKHNKKEDCWIAVEGQVYNVTNFLESHPGGPSVILKVAGTDATKHFLKFHPTSVTRLLDDSEKLGPLDGPTAQEEELSPEDKQLVANSNAKPSLGEIYNLYDFEEVARHTLNRTGWYYYSSGADDEMTLRENHRAYQRIWFRPRILIDVANVDFSTKFFGTDNKAPFYITATALAKLGHPEGETALTKAAHRAGITQMLSTLSSCSIDEVAAVAQPHQPIWMQVYVNADRKVTANFIRHAEGLGVRGFFVTVDAPQLGRREKDMRSKYDEDLADVQGEGGEADRSQGAARAISSFIDPGLSWKDVPFLRSLTKKPLVLKGVQRWEDAVRAAELGLDGVVLSNHGGRQLDFARSGIEVLAEVMPELKKRGLHIEVYVDGGIRRGTDIVKALCLGAKGVGIGRPFLYALSTYGEEGVIRAINLLKDEIEMNMRLIGAQKVSDLNPSFVDTRNLSIHDSNPVDFAYEGVYERLSKPAFKNKL